MRELVISAVRHAAGAAAAAVVTFLAGVSELDFSVLPVGEVGEGVEALVLALALGVYALVEKGLKPLFVRFFGSHGA